MESLVTTARQKMQKALGILAEDFATVRSGKASPALIENIVIPAYQGTAHLKVLELATIHVQDNSTIVISPFDKSILGDIEKGISAANVGLNPIVDGDILRINLPPLTEERRQELTRMIKQKAESGKVMIRQIRHESMTDAKKQEEAGHVSEDEVTRVEKEIQRLTDEFSEKVESMTAAKEKELMTL